MNVRFTQKCPGKKNVFFLLSQTLPKIFSLLLTDSWLYQLYGASTELQLTLQGGEVNNVRNNCAFSLKFGEKRKIMGETRKFMSPTLSLFPSSRPYAFHGSTGPAASVVPGAVFFQNESKEVVLDHFVCSASLEPHVTVIRGFTKLTALGQKTISLL